jgi:transcriptional regulator with XRE-family HTH domain
MKTIHDPRYQSAIKWLSAARKQQGLTVRQFAELMGHSHSWVVKVEKCDISLDVLEFINYCKALKLDPVEGYRLMLPAQSTPANP